MLVEAGLCLTWSETQIICFLVQRLKYYSLVSMHFEWIVLCIIHFDYQAKAEGKKLKKVSLKVTSHGIRVQDMMSKEVCVDLSIYRYVCFMIAILQICFFLCNMCCAECFVNPYYVTNNL